MSTALSININKIALLRNSRGRDYPNVETFSERFLQLGAKGITLHPRPDQRHARYTDIAPLKQLCDRYQAELNVEGYPTQEFLAQVIAARPAQCTLVPDDPTQLTSDHGWHIHQHQILLKNTIDTLTQHGIRVSLFVDVNNQELALAKALGATRVELYTEPYAQAYQTAVKEGNIANNTNLMQVLAQFANTAQQAQDEGLGVNAGHDLNLENLALFLSIPNILEVSIGHAVVVECLEFGIESVIQRYCNITC